MVEIKNDMTEQEKWAAQNVNNAKNETKLSKIVDSIVEEGSNENGSYIQLVNGVMICTKTVAYTTDIKSSEGSMYYGSRTSLGNYAKSFVDVPLVLATNVSKSSLFFDTIKHKSSTSFGTLNAYRTSALSDVTVVADLVAIGRWK